MIGIHSVFTNKGRGFIYGMGHDLSVSELYTWVYSILTWKRSGNPIYLYCDEQIKEFVEKYGFDNLYDEVRVREYDLDIHECFWSYKKILPIKEFGEPVCLFDIDTYFRDTSFTELHNDMMCYHYESWGMEYLNKFYNDKEEFTSLSFYEPIDKDFNVVNGSLLVFNSYDLKTEFLNNAKEVVESIKEISYDTPFEYDSYTIFMEQINLGYLNKKYHCNQIANEGEWGLYNFNSKEPFVHLGHSKHNLNRGNKVTRDFYNHILKEEIIKEGYPKYSKLFNLTETPLFEKTETLTTKRKKLNNTLIAKDKVNNKSFNEWFEENRESLITDNFQIAMWGSINGNDIDLLLTKKGNTTIKELEDYISKIIKSGDKHNIIVDVLYVSDMDYFREFRTKNSRKVYESTFIGFYSENDYNPIGNFRRIGKMNFYLGPFNDAFYQLSIDDGRIIEYVDSVKEIKDSDNYVQYSSEVYNTIYERFGIFSLIE